MPEADSSINALAAAIADDARIDWDRTAKAGVGDSNLDLVRQFRIISAMGADTRQAAADPESWQRAVWAIWATVIAVAAVKVAVAGWGASSVFASAGGALRPSAVTLLLFGLTGALLIIGGARDRRVRCLGAFFLLIASAFANRLIPHLDAGDMGPYALELRRLPVDAFLPLTLWLFVRGFPSEPKLPLARRVADGFVVGSAGLGGLLFAANVWHAHADAGVRALPAATMLRVLDREAPTLAYWPLLFAVMGLALPYLVWKLRLETVEAKQRGAVFIIALVAGITPMLLTVIATPFVPALRDPSFRDVIGWVLYGALVSVIPSTAYAVVVRRVMDVHLILRRTSQHTLARYAVWIASVGPLTYLFADMYLRRGGAAPELAISRQSILFFVLPFAGFGVLVFRDRLLRAVDGWFLRGAADYAEALARVEQGLRDARSLREIGMRLACEIRRTIHPTGIAVFVVDDACHQLVDLDGEIRPLSTQSVLVDLLRQIRCDIQFDPQPDGPVARLLPPGDRAWLADGQLTLLCPLVDSTGRLLGAVGVGESLGGLPYTKQDRMFITAISGRAAMQLENRWLQESGSEERGGPRPGGLVAIDWDNEPGAHCPTCGTMWPGDVRVCACHTPAVPAALPIMLKGKFRVERLIGSGGMGIVYLAVDLTLDRKVAIKALPNVTPGRVAWLQREARTMASMLHPNLALIYGAEQWRGTTLLIVEYLEGGTLSDHLARGVLGVAEVIDLGIVLADVLDRLHTSGILHRDIKPSNIAYTRDGVPKLLDFGVAAIMDCPAPNDDTPAGTSTPVADLVVDAHPRQTFVCSTRRLMGTPMYLSPEAVAGRVPQPSFDLWSLSLVLYEALTMQHPFNGESVAQVFRLIQATQVPDVRDFRPDCPPELAALLGDSLSLVLIRRPATATDLRSRLQRLRGALSPAIA